MDDDTTGATDAHTHPGYMHRKDDYLKRMRRIEGQVRGIERMVEEETSTASTSSPRCPR